MRHAGDLFNRAGAVERVEPGIAVCMHPAPVAGEVLGGMLALQSTVNRYQAAGGDWPSHGRSSRT
jgi:hypothetical protein